jgi:hypothetical protein
MLLSSIDLHLKSFYELFERVELNVGSCPSKIFLLGCAQLRP